jgi:hypothetical protein
MQFSNGSRVERRERLGVRSRERHHGRVVGGSCGLVGFMECATPLGQDNLTFNNPVAAMVTQPIAGVRDVAGWVGEHQASAAYYQRPNPGSHERNASSLGCPVS